MNGSPNTRWASGPSGRSHRSSSRASAPDVLEGVLVDSPAARSAGVDSGSGAGGGPFVEAEPVAPGLRAGAASVPGVEASPSGDSPGVGRSNGRMYSDPRVGQVVGDRRPVGDRSPRVVADGPVAPRVPSAVGRSTVVAGAAHGTHLPPGVGRSRVPAVAVGGVPGDGIGQPLPGGDPGALPPGTSTSLVLSGGNIASESGIVVMLPDPQAPGGLRAVQVPLASYVKQARGVGSGFFEFIGLGSSAFRAGLMGFVILALILFFGYLGSTLVANRYQFHEVQVAPGRSQFYRIDRWTGEMQRCQTDYRTARSPGAEGAPPPVC